MEKDNGKIITFSFIIMGVIGFITAKVLLVTAAAGISWVARVYNQDIVQHGFPVAVGILIFLALQLNAKAKLVADEAINEIRKVVWPSRKDTVGMTIVVCVMLLVATAIFGTFDFFARNMIRVILN